MLIGALRGEELPKPPPIDFLILPVMQCEGSDTSPLCTQVGLPFRVVASLCAPFVLLQLPGSPPRPLALGPTAARWGALPASPCVADASWRAVLSCMCDVCSSLGCLHVYGAAFMYTSRRTHVPHLSPSLAWHGHPGMPASAAPPTCLTACGRGEVKEAGEGGTSARFG